MKKSLFLFSLFSCVILCQAQTPLYKELKIIYNGKGLQVSCLILDNEGIIWLGGPQGVFTYNGNALKQVYNANRMSKAIVALYQDKAGQIWAGSKGGNILKFFNYQNTVFAPKNGFPKTEITSIAEAKSGDICFGTRGEGVFLYQSDKLLNTRTGANIEGNTINCLLKNAKGELLAGTNEGIAYLMVANNSIKVSKRLDTTNGLISNQVKALSYYRTNNLVIGYFNRGANMYNEQKGTFSIVCNESTTVNSIETFENELWLGTELQGIFDCEFEPKVIVRNLQILENYGVIRVQKIINTPFYFQIVLGDNKVFVTQGEWFQKITVPEEINNLQPKALAVANNNIIAIYGNGIFKKSILDNSEWRAVNLLHKINYKDVSSVAIDANANIWISSKTEGIYCFNEGLKMIKHYDQLNGLLDDCIYHLTLLDDLLYYGSKNGLGYININDFDPQIT